MNGNGPRKALKTSYRASPRSLRPLYTGGPVLITKDGEWLITTMDEEVLITEVKTGLSIAKIRGDGSAITSLCLSYHTSPPTLITSHLSLTIRYYPLPSDLPLSHDIPLLSYSRSIPKASTAPILLSASSPDSTLFATASSDGVVKVYDTAGAYITHIYRGHGGPVSALRFWYNTEGTRMELWTGSSDSKVRVFDLRDAKGRVVGGNSGGKAKWILEGHVSVVRGIDVSVDCRWAVTGGRDKVVLVWDLHNEGTGKKKGKEGKGVPEPKIVQTIIAQEQVEALGLLPVGEDGRLRCFTGGDKGVVRIWDVLKAEEVVSMRGLAGVDEVDEDDEEDEQRGVINVLLDSAASSLISVHADQNIIFHSLNTNLPTRQIIGFNDEIIDASLLSHPSSSSTASSHSHLALATNSNLIRLYSLSTFDARLITGHKDMVLCLTTSSDHTLLVSGSKDQTARIYTANPEIPGDWTCTAICEGHAESIGALTLSRKTSPPQFLITASQDRTLKLWDLSTLPLATASSPVKPRSLSTVRAHEKDINSLDLSPNDKFLASGSQDKLVKIFSVDYPGGGMKLVGVCKGHRRGVWTVKFSPTDRVVASGAADRTVRLWSLDDFTCLKTFEGHTNSVLRVDFLSMGMQLVTSSSDGLVKLWNIKDEECVKTLDNHEDKVWALAISSDEKTIVSAGADSVATFWEDATQAEQSEKNEALVKSVQAEQDFTNYLVLKDYRRAILLALAQSQPGRLLKLFTSILSTPDSNPDSPNTSTASHTGSIEIDQVIRTLTGTDLIRLLRFIRDWNTNARTSPVAQGVLHAILRLRTPEDIIAAFDSAQKVPVLQEAGGGEGEGEGEGEESGHGKKRRNRGSVSIGIGELLDGLIPYSERHYKRLERLTQDSYVLDYVVSEMDGGVFGGEVMEVD